MNHTTRLRIAVLAIAMSAAGCTTTDRGDESDTATTDTAATDTDSADEGDATSDADTTVDGEEDADLTPWPGCIGMETPAGELADKADQLDELVPRQHLDDRLLRTVIVGEGGEVTARVHLESTGLWTAIYLASQALRYAVTSDEEAVENARVAVAGLHDLTAVTGTPGLYGRAYDRPDVAYTSDPSTLEPSWIASPSSEHDGWWYRGDVSKDTMDGILFGYSTALEHFDDPELLDAIRADVVTFVERFVDDGLQILDHTGTVTEHGRLFYSALDDWPGFNALLSMSWVRLGVDAGADVEAFYRDCLLQTGDGSWCPDIDGLDMGSYIDAFEEIPGTYVPDCKTNFDTIDMTFQAIYPLIRRENDPEVRERLLTVLRDQIWDPAEPVAPPVHRSTHSLYIYMYGALADPSRDDEVFRAALSDAACTLYRIPADRTDRDVAAGDQEQACTNRHGEPAAAEVIPLEERQYDNYIWRLSPYTIPQAYTAVPSMVHSPDDWLLAYWLGRYHGFVSPEM